MKKSKTKSADSVRCTERMGETLGQAFDRLRGEGWNTDRELILLRKSNEYAIIHADGMVTVISVSPIGHRSATGDRGGSDVR